MEAFKNTLDLFYKNEEKRLKGGVNQINKSKRLAISVLGHPYVIHDHYISMKSLFKIMKGMVYAVRTIFMVDKLYELANYTRCREKNKGYTDKVMEEFKNSVQNAKGYKGIKKEIALTKRMLKSIEIDSNYKPLKIAIVGEIYAATERYVNLDIERKLGNRGVEVYNKLSVGSWIKEDFIKNILPIKSKDTPHEAGYVTRFEAFIDMLRMRKEFQIVKDTISYPS